MNPNHGGTRSRDLRSGLFALLALLFLCIAVPVGLWALAGWPLPSTVPSWSSITDALGSSQVPDDVLVKALAVVCWLVWIELVASVLVEAVALVRGRRAADVPLAGPLQKMAGRLVAAVAILIVLSAARADAPASAPRPLLVPGTAVVLDLASAEPVAAPVAQPGLPTYTVQPRDTLWDIAERHLSDARRWGEIWDLNREQPQVDGAAFSDPDLIQPGWKLSMPADSVGLAPVAEPTAQRVPTDTGDVERLVPVQEDSPSMVLAVDHDQELLVPLDAPVDHGR
jgi:LysM repeat protein